MKCKCQIIPACVFDNIPPVVHEDDNHRYILGKSGHLVRLSKKSCFTCSASAAYVVILEYKTHRKVERYCVAHASKFGVIPDIPQLEINKNQLPKQTVKALANWNMQIRI